MVIFINRIFFTFFFYKLYNTSPSFLLIILIYWIINTPYSINLRTVFITSCCIDFLKGFIFGVHFFSIIIFIYFIQCKLSFFYQLVSWKKTLIIMFFLLLINNIAFILESFFLKKPFESLIKILLETFQNGIFWIFFSFLIKKTFNRFHICV
ncbi:rod shape-determining protein MreD [Candidatus Tachikawaea gelatinosa]|uniref:Rod shape-determining protein MreD n=1 Tax=Candidatus Tachikawaea gelatinosa TaxID=1410383 RepID=A0A090AM07_9ENTR|nr:rod shape-determining protein MreD [Candidatus Tachikawaea gelatinosa]